MFSRRFWAVALCTFVVIVTVGGGPTAAEEDRSPKNLQFFPKDMKREDLIPLMRNFSFALGVACTHCHGTEEQTGFNLSGVDFSLDIKPAKEKARSMLRMTDEINKKLLAPIPASSLDLKVRCFTCHSGLPLPESIEDRVLRKIYAKGIDSAIEDYRAVREDYHGSAAYNFLQQPLVEVASALHGDGQYKEAAAISKLNLEFHPESGQSRFRLAEAYFQLGDKESARRTYREILSVRPEDKRVLARLEELGDTQP